MRYLDVIIINPLAYYIFFLCLQIFPTVTKCTFKMYDPSGTLQIYHAICLLPINAINRKIFIFLWFWFIILSILSGFAVLLSLAKVVSPKIRFFLLQKAAGKGRSYLWRCYGAWRFRRNINDGARIP